MDFGTRQWTPDDDLHSARMGLQRRLDTQRARRNASPQRAANAALAQITLSYEELLKALSYAAATGRGVTLTRTADNVYLKLTGPSDAEPSRDCVATLIEAEQAIRDRLEANVARRYLELHGPDHVVGESDAEFDEEAEASDRMRI
jgi:hypothetical protein